MTNGNCIEIAAESDGILVRDSMNRAEAAIRYSARAWRAFLADAKIGKYDPTGDLLRLPGSRGTSDLGAVEVEVRAGRGGTALVLVAGAVDGRAVRVLGR